MYEVSYPLEVAQKIGAELRDLRAENQQLWEVVADIVDWYGGDEGNLDEWSPCMLKARDLLRAQDKG